MTISDTELARIASRSANVGEWHDERRENEELVDRRNVF